MKITEDPHVMELRERIRMVRKKTLETLVLIEDANLQLIPQLKCDYAVKIGRYEIEAVQEELAARRARKKLALARMSQARHEAIDEMHIEAELDRELAQWKSELEKRTKAYNEELARKAGTKQMPYVDARRLSKLFHELAKRLHPDLHPGDAERTRLFAIAQAAYENGNIELLEALEVSTRQYHEEDDLEKLFADELESCLEIEQIQLDAVREKYQKMLQEEPLSLAEKLADSLWVEEKITPLKQRIELARTARHRMEDEFESLLEDYNG